MGIKAASRFARCVLTAAGVAVASTLFMGVAHSQEKTSVQMLGDAIVARDRVMVATLSPGGLIDWETEAKLSVGQFFERIERCSIKGIDASRVLMDCSAKRSGRPTGKCLTGDYTIIYLREGGPAVIGLATVKKQEPGCSFTPHIPALSSDSRAN